MRNLLLLLFIYTGTQASGWTQDTVIISDTERVIYSQDRDDRLRDDDDWDNYRGWSRSYRSWRSIQTRYILLDLGFSDLYTDDAYFVNGYEAFELRLGKSLNVNLHVMHQRLSIFRHVGLQYGLTFEFHKHSFDNPITILEDQPEVTFAEIETESRIKNNRLGYTYLTIPFMLTFETHPRRFHSFHFAAGGFGGVLLGGSFKIKTSDGKEKIRDNFNLNQFRYGVRAQVGFGPLIFYGQLALNELFDKDENGGFEVYPFSWGISVWPF